MVINLVMLYPNMILWYNYTMGRRGKYPQLLLTVSQVADMWNVHPNTVKNQVHRDGLRAYCSPAGDLLMSKDNLTQFLAKLFC